MKYISFFIIFCLFFLNSYKSYAEDALTIKQQLDRVVEEVKDLNRAVFNKSFDKNQIYSTENNDDTERFTSIDIRIYELEKDIKNLTLQFEEILFKLDDISKDMNSLETDLFTKLEKIKIDSKKNNIDSNKIDSAEKSSLKEENTLGKIIISDNNQVSTELDSSSLAVEDKKIEQAEELNNLTPEEQLQFALNQMMKKNYEKSKKILEEFIVNFSDNHLSGSAHFWLGEIYFFEKNYRQAALVFGAGVQKFPKSKRAPEMYYQLAKSLKEMGKSPEACKTLTLLEEKYKGNKYTKDPDKIKDKLNC